MKLLQNRRAYTLPELLVVLGIVIVLIAILIPVVIRARRQAGSTACLSNLRSIGQMLQIYANTNRGWVFPVKNDAFGVIGLGLNVAPHQRWPMKVFDMKNAPLPPLYDPADYTMADCRKYDPRPYTPPVLTCPSDDDPLMAHTYVLNNHLADENIRFGSRIRGITPSDVVVAGEKKNRSADYYMEYGDYEQVVEPYRHGKSVGSNYLYLDLHAAAAAPKDARQRIDPWDVAEK